MLYDECMSVNAWEKLSPELKAKYEHQIPVQVVDLANDLNVKVLSTDSFQDEHSGSIAYVDGNFVIYINKNHPYTRKMFSIAHEIGHFLLHPEEIKVKSELITDIKMQINGVHRTDNGYGTPEEKKMEREANEFAASLLMPEIEFTEAFNEANDISEVARKFGVSESAATIRASKLMGQFFS